MKIFKTKIKDCFYFYSDSYNDIRGKTNILNFNFKIKNNYKFSPDQLIISKSKKNVFRGFHIQLKFPQEKIVSVLQGKIDDYIFDLRKSSKTYNSIIKLNLKKNDNKFVYIPKGCAHGFYAKDENNEVIYLIKGEYKPKFQTGINIYDPVFKKIKNSYERMIVSKKDKKLPFFIENK